MNGEIKQCFDFDNSFIEPNWDLRNCFVENNKTYPLQFTEEYLENIEEVAKKQDKTIFATYQDKFDLMYQIELLQKQNTELKEKIILLQASEPMLEFAKQTYKANWNKLKEWLEEEIQDSLNTWGEVYPRDTYKNVLEQMQEIEGGMND